MNGNYGIVYPKESDYYDVNVTNSNFSLLADSIDAIKSGGLKREVVVAAYNTSNIYKSAADFICSSADATEAVKNAVEKCCEGGMIVFLDGDYYLSSTVNIDKQMTLCGYGCKSKIIQSENFTGYTLFYVKSDNVCFRDVLMEDNIKAISGIHMITAYCSSIVVGDCYFNMLRSGEDNSVAPLYTQAYNLRVMMSGCYIRKYNDNKYSINSPDTDLRGVVMGNYCENIETGNELPFAINVREKGNVGLVKYAAQDTVFKVKGAAYSG